MSLQSRDYLALIDAQLERRRTGQTKADQAAELRGSFRLFVEKAWPLIVPGRFIPTWHIDTLADHYQAAVEREILALIVSIQPRVAKSSVLNVLGPAWAWTRNPAEKILSGSHADDLSTRDTRRSRMLMQTEWFIDLFGETFAFASDENLKTRYSNDKGGHRIRTHVGGGTGDGGTLLILDDPHNAKEQYSDTKFDEVWAWWGDTWVSRLDDTTEERGVMVVCGQRIGEGDLIGRLLASGGRDWHHVCLPTEYEPKHPFVYPEKVTLPSGRVMQGDRRTEEGALLAPDYQSREILDARTADMARSVYAAQYQQNPAPKEGFLLKRANWRYYPADRSFYSRERLDAERARVWFPEFRMIVHSWDTSVKDRLWSDFVSGQTWGIPADRPADRWLLRLYHKQAALNETIEAMLDQAEWAEEIWPGVRTYTVVENTANGPDAIREIRSKIQGVVVWEAKGSKYQRAEAASPALDGRNLIVPGWPTAEGDSYDPATPQQVQRFIEELAKFQGERGHDDQVDAWSQMVNYTRTKRKGKGRAYAQRAPLPNPVGLPA